MKTRLNGVTGVGGARRLSDRAGRVGVCSRLLLLLVAMPAITLAHRDIDERIATLDARIAERPAARELYLKRGELHRQHRDWPAALADYRRAHALSVAGEAADIDFHTGRMWWQAGAPERALFDLGIFIDAHPEHVAARLARARVYAELGWAAAAVGDMDVAIRHQEPPIPGFYLERARLLNDDLQQPETALRGLDEGIARLGPVVSLVQLAIEIEVATGSYGEALQRIERLPAPVKNNPGWLAKKADILKAMGDAVAAREAYALALAAIERLPPGRRSTPLVSSLERELGNALGAGRAAVEP